MRSRKRLTAHWTNERGDRAPLPNCTAIVVELAPGVEVEIQLERDSLFPEQVLIAAPPTAREEEQSKAGIVDLLCVRPVSATALRLGIHRRKERPSKRSVGR